MSESLPAVTPEPPRQKGHAALAWVVIGLAVVLIPASRAWMEQSAAEDANAGISPNRAILLEFQARVLVGSVRLLGPLAAGMDAEIAKLNRGGIDQRMRAIVVIGETAGAAQALQHLDELDALCKKNGVTPTLTQQRALGILRAAYRDFKDGKLDAPSVNAADRAFLADDLGWFGALALHPQSAQAPGEARTEVIRPALITAVAVYSLISLACVFICVGFVGIIIFAVLAWNGSLTWRFQVGSPHGNVYAETFAIWLIWFFGSNMALSVWPLDLPPLMQRIAAFFASLLVLGWPIVRGIPWQQVRSDIGYVSAANPLKEIAAGFCCYVINLPLVALGFAATAGLLLLQTKLQAQASAEGSAAAFADQPMPTHPILQFLRDADWGTLAQIFVLASIAAPLVEETMFRGVLHRHCRELTSRWRPILSALFSTCVVSFIFAEMHPQGLVTIPLLGSMAFGFSLAREWRASLLPSMFAHGMSNGIVLTAASIALAN